MQFGLGVLRLSPREFWAMTPRELASAVVARGGRRATPLPRETLASLMSAFPDTEAAHGR
jgi:uncharacterized phage protein (TIGR02216 family)